MKRRTLIATLVMVTALSMTACKGANEEGVMHNAQVEMRNEESSANEESVIDNSQGKNNAQLDNAQGVIDNAQSGDNSDDNSELSIPNYELEDGIPNSELKEGTSDTNSDLRPTNSELPVATATPIPNTNAESKDNSQGDTNSQGGNRNEKSEDGSDDNSELSPSNSELDNDSDDNSELSTPNYELPTPTPAPTPEPEDEILIGIPTDGCLHAGTTERLGWGKIEEVAVGECYHKFYYLEWKCNACGAHWIDEKPAMGSDSKHNQHKKGTDIPATCTTDGYEYGWTCDCGERDTEDPGVIPASGHKYEIYQVGSRYIDTTVSGGDACGYTEWHYEERCRKDKCGHVSRDWWSTDASEAW